MAPTAESTCPFDTTARAEASGKGAAPHGQSKSLDTPPTPILKTPQRNDPTDGDDKTDVNTCQSPGDCKIRAGSGVLGVDPKALLKALVPLESFLGLGALLAALLGLVLPPPLVLLPAAAVVLLPLLRMAYCSWGLLRNADAAEVMPGSVTDVGEGEFCIFLLGARNNASFKLDMAFADVGQMFEQTLQELTALLESAGFLGHNTYVASDFERDSHVMAVTYWQSFDRTMKFAHDSALSHTSTLKELSKKLPSMPHIGLWHEAYIVKPGQHESVYLNCPPLGLGAAMGCKAAEGPLATARGRIRASQGRIEKPNDN